MSYGDTEPSEFHGGEARGALPLAPVNRVTFDRRELNRIFGLYGRKVAAGEWRKGVDSGVPSRSREWRESAVSPIGASAGEGLLT